MKGFSRVFCVLVAVAIIIASIAACADLTDKQRLGKLLFFDTNLSSPRGQSCGSCHDPDHGFTDPRTSFPTSQGVLPGRMGFRNSPTVTYLATAPDFTTDLATGASSGGHFLDGRAVSLFELAKQPFLNPIEMHSPNEKLVVHGVSKAAYAGLFTSVFGSNSLEDYRTAYPFVAEAIDAFLKSPELNRFDSKFDYVQQGEAEFTEQEALGFSLFQQKNCIACHVITPNAAGGPPVFTRFGYSNVGVPRNPDNPFFFVDKSLNPEGDGFQDRGLAVTLEGLGATPAAVAAQEGKFNFPTLRNIEKTGPYFHNGVFKDLETVVHFLNTRDVPSEGFVPEFPATKSGAVGNLGMTSAEEDALVAFMKTLTDGYEP